MYGLIDEPCTDYNSGLNFIVLSTFSISNNIILQHLLLYIPDSF